jgi:agmatinase
MGSASLPNSFGALEEEYSSYERSRVVIIPVPYEGTVTYVKGTSRGPKAIVEASKNMELYDEELGRNTFEVGIHTLKQLDVRRQGPERVIGRVARSVRKVVAANKFPVVLGGEHSITLGAVRALRERFPSLSVLQLDAHADLRESYEGTRFNHACVMARVRELCPAVQVGVRSLSDEEAALIREKNLCVFWAKDIHDNDEWVDDAVSRLSGDVYVTIDLDVFDAGIMPSVGTPEPGGLGWYQTLVFLRGVAEGRNIVGFDVVELTPNDSNIAPDFLAAKLTYKLIGYVFCR